MLGFVANQVEMVLLQPRSGTTAPKLEHRLSKGRPLLRHVEDGAIKNPIGLGGNR